MSKKDEALKLALEALKQIDDAMPFPVAKLAQKVIREALAEQPEQEPVIDKSAAIRIATALGWEPRREWVALTDEERNNLWREVIGWGDPSHDEEDLMKAIEAKLREKNT